MAASIFTGLPGCAEAQSVDVLSLIQGMANRDTLAIYPAPGTLGGEADSKDPQTRTRYFYSDTDGGNFLRDQVINGRTEHVMLDVDGPGAITRLVVLGPSFAGHTIRYYLDGSTTPAIEADLNTLMTGGSFVHSPLVFAAGPKALTFGAPSGVPPGLDLYLPVPFAHHALITYDGPENAKLQPPDQPFPILDFIFEYRLFPPATAVTTFTQAQFTGSQAQIDAALSTLSAILPVSPNTTPGTSTAQAYTDPQAVRLIAATLAPGQSATGTFPAGSHAVRFLGINAGASSTAVAGIEMALTFDGEKTVDTRIGPFFGSGMTFNPGTTEMQSVGADGTMTTRWTMPYQSSASVTLTNHSGANVTVSLSADAGAWSWDANSMHLHAYQRLNGPMITSNNQVSRFLDVRGQGVYVGDNETTTEAQDAADTCYNWWGEGDEMFFVDGDVYPSYRGTGTEDYFGYAYGHTYLFQSPWVSQIATPPQTGQAANKFTYDGVTVLNRVRLLDTVPFTNRLRFDFEIDDHDQGGPVCQQGTKGPRPSGLAIDHTAFFYAKPGATLVPDGVVSGSTYTIQSKIAGWNLTTDDAGQLTEDVFADDGTQRFTVKNLSGSIFTLQNTSTGLFVGAVSGNAGQALSLGAYTGACGQQWTIAPILTDSTPLGGGPGFNGYYSLINGCSGGLAMDVVNGSTASEGVVQQYTPSGGDSQGWRFNLSVAQAPPVLANGTYTLINATSGPALDVPNGSTGSGQALQQYTPNGSSSQSWAVNSLGGGFYSVRSTHGGLALDNGGSRADDAPLPQNPWGNSPGERWRLLPFGGNHGLALISTDNNEQFQMGVGFNSIAPGGPIQQQQLGEGTERIWNFEPVSGGTAVANGTYVVVNRVSGQALDVVGAGKGNSVPVQQFGIDGSAAQQWVLAQQNNGSYSILNVNSGSALDNAGASLPGASPDQYAWSNGPNQNWEIAPAPGGGYQLVNVANRLALGPPSSVSGDTVSCGGSSLQQQAPFSPANPVAAAECQRWDLVEAGPTPAPIAPPAMPPGSYGAGTPQQLAAPVICASEGQTCAFSGPALVSFGVPFGAAHANNVFLEQAAVNGAPCAATFFGSDPDPGYPKACWYTLLPAAVRDGVYAISNQASHLPLDVVNGSTLNGGLLQQYTADGGAFQQWQITNQGNGFYSVLSMGSGRALDSYGSGGEGSQLRQYLWLDTPSQLWEIQPNLDGSYTFLNQVTPGYTLQVQGGSLGAGAAVAQLPAAAGSAQNWNLQPLSGPPVSPGVYSLLNRNSHLALDVLDGLTKPGTVVQQTFPSELANQQWAVSRLANGSYLLRNINTGQLLDSGGVTNRSLGAPAVEELPAYPYPASQQWTLSANGDGSFRLVNAANALLLGASGASLKPAPTAQYTDTGAADQGWLLQAAPVRLPTGTYRIRNANSKLLMEVAAAGTANSDPVQQYFDDNSTGQEWNVVYQANSDKIYVLTNVNSGRALDNAAATTPGIQADQYGFFDTNNMRWQILSNNDGSYSLQNVANGFALNIAGDATNPNAPVVQEVVGASGSQRWNFDLLP